MNNGMEKEIFEVYLEDIIPNRFQPRLTFDDKALTDLANSIKEHGIIQPLVLRKTGDKYEIIAGERRYKAASIAGLQKVPAVVMNLDDNKSAELAVVENVQRQNLNAIEEAESYKKLLDRNYLTQEQLATRMGKTQATISNKLRLLNLDEEVRDSLLNEKISERHARSLLSLRNPVDQKDALHKIIDNKLTVRQTDDLIKSMTGISPVTSTTEDDTVPDTGGEFVRPFNPININNPTPPVTPVVPFFQEDNSTSNPFMSPNAFTPISDININKEKEESQDINPPKEVANIDNLLSINNREGFDRPVEELKPVNPPIVETMNKNRFIPDFDDEKINIEIPTYEEPKPEEPKKFETLDLDAFTGFSFNNQPLRPIEESKQVESTPIESVPIDVSPMFFQPEPVHEEPKPEEPKQVESTPIESAPIDVSPMPSQPEPVYEEPKPEESKQVESTPIESTPIDVSLMPSQPEPAYEEPKPEIMTNNQSVVSGDLKSAITAIRDAVKTLEKNGFTIDVEEFDFEHLYQLIVKINK